MRRQRLVEEARSLLGVRWIHQGRHSTQGIDCVGLPILVGQQFGLWEKEVIANYPRRPDGTFVQNFKQYLDMKKNPEHMDGDVLLFSKEGLICHCGIRSTFRGQPGIIHAYAGYRKVVEQTLESGIASIGRVSHVFSFPGVED